MEGEGSTAVDQITSPALDLYSVEEMRPRWSLTESGKLLCLDMRVSAVVHVYGLEQVF